jgi:hypothetical protein
MAITPYLLYRDAGAAVDWLVEAYARHFQGSGWPRVARDADFRQSRPNARQPRARFQRAAGDRPCDAEGEGARPQTRAKVTAMRRIRYSVAMSLDGYIATGSMTGSRSIQARARGTSRREGQGDGLKRRWANACDRRQGFLPPSNSAFTLPTALANAAERGLRATAAEMRRSPLRSPMSTMS